MRYLKQENDATIGPDRQRYSKLHGDDHTGSGTERTKNPLLPNRWSWKL